AEYELTLEPKILADQLDYRMGRKRPSWTLADFEFSHKKKDPAQQRFSYLLTAFAGEAHAETGIASTKIELAREELGRYLVQRHAGELDDAPTPRRQRRKQKRATAQSAHPLCPDAKTLDFFLARLLGFLSFQHYEAFALFELLPAWLRFLARHGLLDEAARQHTLQEISYIKGELKTFAENQVNDPALAVNLAGWPDER
ncbi:MAG: hypothetical protein KC425_02385, partial [Anaerolineales bacterium]|nr:hypothetical protein [Anaerolineales bacterium]